MALRHDIVRENVLKLFVCTMVQLALSHVPMPGGFRWERLRCLLAFVAAVFVALAVAPPALTQSQQQTDALAHYDRGYARQSRSGRIPLRDPPCPVGQVGEGVSPTLDAGPNMAGSYCDVEG